MMKLYNFKRLIRKYSVKFTLHRTGGAFIAGKWEEDTKGDVTMYGAIVPMGERKVYSSGGAYTTQDRELYVTKALPSPLSTLRVIHDDNIYSVEDCRDFKDYADVAVYNLKWVSKK